MVINRRLIFVIFMVLVLMSLLLVPTNAMEYDKKIITPKFSYISSFQNDFDISVLGKTSVASHLYAINSDEVRVTGYLQQYKDGGWSNVKSWTESSAGNSVALEEDYYVETGYTYRYILYGYVYVDGYVVESTSYESSKISY